MSVISKPLVNGIDAGTVLSALAVPILVVDGDNRIRFVNPAAEQFFDAGASFLGRQHLGDLVPFGSPVLNLVRQVQDEGHTVSEYGVNVGTPRIGAQSVDIQVSPVTDAERLVVVQLEPRTIAHKMDRQLTHRGAARSVTGMAAILAHEVKNPLSGIRGAAQLLEQNASPQDRDLTRLICDETDRICALVDRMEVFADKRPMQRGPVNIHQVLEHVRRWRKTALPGTSASSSSTTHPCRRYSATETR